MTRDRNNRLALGKVRGVPIGQIARRDGIENCCSKRAANTGLLNSGNTPTR